MSKQTFNEYMAETKSVNRWLIVKVGLSGGFCGALLTTGFLLFGLA